MPLDIAIVGLQIRLPGAETPWELHRLLLTGEDQISRFEVKERGWVGARGLIERYDHFDADLFHLPESQVRVLDPQHRLLLEGAHQVLEAAGFPPGRAPLPCGVFAACSSNPVHWEAWKPGTQDNPVGLYNLQLGCDKDFLATRIAYHLDLTGPAVTVQTGCSSSLVAVHQACHALRGGDCSLAMVAAASVPLPFKAGYLPSEGMIFSPTGQCNPFTTAADGTVPGTGAIVILLEPLAEALRAGRTVWGLLRGSAINNDGRRKVAFSAPAVDPQIAVQKAALASAGCEPGDIGYIEGHGTGTNLGDAIELAAMVEVYGRNAEAVRLGSIKANVGHLDAASGLAGLAKALLSLKFKVLYPQPRMTRPGVANAAPFPMESKARPWDGGRRRAAVSSLGIGGTNVHLIVEEPPPSVPHARPPVLWFPLAARSRDSLHRLGRQLADALELMPPDEIAPVAATLQRRYGESSGQDRVGFRASQLSDLAASLRGSFQCGERAGGPPNGLPGAVDRNGQGLDAALAGFMTVPLPPTPLESRSFPLPDGSPVGTPPSIGMVLAPSPSGTPERIRAAWRAVLGGEASGRGDAHFFQDGGNSLLAVQFMQELKKQGIDGLALADLYDHPTLDGLLDLWARRGRVRPRHPQADDPHEELDESFTTEL